MAGEQDIHRVESEVELVVVEDEDKDGEVAEEDKKNFDQKSDKSLKSIHSSSSEDSIRRLNRTPTIMVEEP